MELCHPTPAIVSCIGYLLTRAKSEWSERELFWIIKHGIRNTAMPAWAALLADDDIRQVAALVKRFDVE